MKKLFKLSQKIATLAAASVFAVSFAFAGLPASNVSAETTSATETLADISVAEDGTFLDITPPETGGYYGVAHYEFDDSENLGKDSLGNFDLTAGANVAANETNGGVTVGSIMYANKLNGTTTDFSDLMDGSFSISMRAYMSNVSQKNLRLICTGSYANSFAIIWRYSGIQVLYKDLTTGTTGNANIGTGGSSAITTAGNYIFDTDPSWYRITMVYNEADLSFSTMVVREGYGGYETHDGYWFKNKITLSVPCDFGGYEYSFTIGAQSKFGSSNAQACTNSTYGLAMSDFRIYSGVIDDAEMAAIAEYDAGKLETTGGMEKTTLANNSKVLGAAVRLTGEPGLRFEATLNEALVAEYEEAYGEENVSFGMKVVRNHNEQKAYVYVPATNNTLENGVYSFNAVITDLTEEYYATEFTAQVYIGYTVGDVTTYVVAELPLEEKVRSISYVANAAINDTYEVDVDGTSEEKPSDYKYEVSTGVYSPYSQEVRELLSAYQVEE